jgi:cell division protease FtsH
MKTKIETLEKVKSTLKSEFIGLDEIIDKIITAITPWYVTPEVIQRPIVVSLWGMTGTGKTSVISRLIELLDIKK